MRAQQDGYRWRFATCNGAEDDIIASTSPAQLASACYRPNSLASTAMRSCGQVFASDLAEDQSGLEDWRLCARCRQERPGSVPHLRLSSAWSQTRSMSHMAELLPECRVTIANGLDSADIYGRLHWRARSSSWAPRRRQRQSGGAPSCLFSPPPRTPPGMSTSTSTRPADPSTPDWPSTTPCNCWPVTSLPPAWASPRRWASFSALGGHARQAFSLLPCPDPDAPSILDKMQGLA